MLGLVASAGAAWRLLDDTAPAKAAADPADAHQLYIFREQDQVYIELALPGEQPAIEAGACPTFQVHGKAAFTHVEGQGACEPTATGIRLPLAAVRGQSLVSLELHRIMNGSRLDIRYRTGGGRYRQVTFGLSRSKAAIRGALGTGVRIQPR